jgi:hypothetical protein
VQEERTTRAARRAADAQRSAYRETLCMKPMSMFALILTTLLLVACRTADFKVVDALRLGMTSTEAQKTIASFSFERDSVLERPDSGWPSSDGTSINLAGRAHQAELKLRAIVKTAEYYPVHHGLLGFGELFLFYDSNGKLVEFYRHQIN